MFPTVEVRWFYPGRVPAGVSAWFRRCVGQFEEPAPRTDYYLCLAGGDVLGVKLREGRIEIKGRGQQFGVVRFHDRVAGLLERWRKWTFMLADAESALARVQASTPAWIGVRKERRLRRYGLVDGSQVVAIAPGVHAPWECCLELTRIDVAGRPWWSVAFEASGDASALRENLLTTARHVLGAADPPALTAVDSCGYPHWLDGIRRS